MTRYNALRMSLGLVALWLAACTSTPGGAQPTVTVAPTATPTQASTPTEVVSHGGPVKDYVSLVDNLRAAGATVDPAGEVEQTFFSPLGYVITVNGVDVQTFEYPDDAAAESEAAQVAPDGSSIGTTMVTWVETPHFYRQGRVIALYVGEDAATLTLLESVLGAQFAGG